MADESSGKTSTAERLINVTGSILVPILLAGFGFYFTFQQRQIETQRQLEQQRIEERRANELRERDEFFQRQQREIEDIRQLIELFTHQEDNKRRMGVDLFEYLVSEARIPKEFQQVLEDYAKSLSRQAALPPSPPKKKSKADETTETDIEPSQPVESTATSFADQVAQAAKQAKASIRPRVYFHISDALQRPDAERVKQMIEQFEIGGQLVVVPGIDGRVQGPGKTKFRFFRTNEAQEARKIFERLKQIIGDVEIEDLSRAYADAKIRPRHYELWFGPEPISVAE